MPVVEMKMHVTAARVLAAGKWQRVIATLRNIDLNSLRRRSVLFRATHPLPNTKQSYVRAIFAFFLCLDGMEVGMGWDGMEVVCFALMMLHE
jgi:hypothetical protein